MVTSMKSIFSPLLIGMSGGPGGGKTLGIDAIVQHFGDKVMVVPEVASMLLNGGFPSPGAVSSEHRSEVQHCLQRAIFATQIYIERAAKKVAEDGKRTLVIVDRTLMDGAGYFPGGVAEFWKLFGDQYPDGYEAMLKRYALLIHMQSAAVEFPTLYTWQKNACTKGDERRFESPEEARTIDVRIMGATREHPRRIVVSGRERVAHKISILIEEVESLLAGKPHKIAKSGIAQCS